MSDLLPGWESAVDPASGNTYYFCRDSGQRTWEKSEATGPEGRVAKYEPADDIDPDCKLYVGGLSFDTSADAFRSHFAKFGDLSDCVLMTDKVTAKSRGFGFVTFKEPSVTRTVLGSTHELDGREISIKKAVRDQPREPDAADPANYNVVKIFVGGLPSTCDLATLKDYFGDFGKIEDAVVMIDQATQRHRGFGFVTFSDNSGVEAAIAKYATNQIDGKWVEVKRCVPQDKMAPGKGKSRGGSSMGSSGSSSNFGGMDAPSSTAAAASAYGYAAMGAMGAYGAYGMPGVGGYGMPMAYGMPPMAYGMPPMGYPGYPPQAYGYGAYGAMAPVPAQGGGSSGRSAPY